MLKKFKTVVLWTVWEQRLKFDPCPTPIYCTTDKADAVKFYNRKVAELSPCEITNYHIERQVTSYYC